MLEEETFLADMLQLSFVLQQQELNRKNKKTNSLYSKNCHLTNNKK